ncbi:MAG: aminoacyl-tRNA hydrolase [Deltaproteobacteria bacterium]|nr:MAG: aminoacyl-tRNA hydrolase [Deltaproteobacteria bacterium]
MIRITGTIQFDEGEIRERFIRSSGPGGQNVNKVATAVELRFDVRGSRSLPEEVRERLIRLAGKKVSREGVLIIQAGRFRTQEQNRRDARERLIRWVRKAALSPKLRRKTRPGGKSVERRLEAKRLQGETKLRRKPVPPSETG